MISLDPTYFNIEKSNGIFLSNMKQYAKLNVMKYELMDQLLHILLSDNNYHTGSELALTLHTSEKTILKYINILREQIQNQGADIEVRQGSGTRLIITDQDLFAQYMKTFSKQENGILDNPATRNAYILMKLLTAQDYISLYDLADELYISPSLLRSILKDLGKTADRYNLRLVNSHRNGYRIIGPEAHIRRCLSQECRQVKDISLSLHDSHASNNEMQILTNIIATGLKSFGIAMSYPTINGLALHLMIAINRLETNHVIELEKNFDTLKLKGSPEYFLASRIAQQVQQELHVLLPENEILYFAMHLNGKQRLNSHDLLQVKVNVDDIIFYNRFLRNIYQMANIDFFEDNELRSSLLNHIVPFRSRVKNDMQINKGDLIRIKDQFPFAYELALYGLSMFPSGRITVSEIAYFALHLELSLEKHAQPKNPCNITVICNDVAGMYQIISFKLNQRFSKQIGMLAFVTPEEILANLDAYNSNTDLYLNLTDTVISLPVKTLSSSEFFTEEELDNIQNAIHALQAKESLGGLMENAIFLDLDANNQLEALAKMTAAISKKVHLPSDFMDRVMAREKMGSTAYRAHIAVPHPLDNTDIPDLLVIARLKKEIIWSKQEVKIIFLLNATSSSASSWFLERTARLVQSPQSMKALLQTHDMSSFMQIFLSI